MSPDQLVHFAQVILANRPRMTGDLADLSLSADGRWSITTECAFNDGQGTVVGELHITDTDGFADGHLYDAA
jgi:hypothetical protein